MYMTHKIIFKKPQKLIFKEPKKIKIDFACPKNLINLFTVA